MMIELLNEESITFLFYVLAIAMPLCGIGLAVLKVKRLLVCRNWLILIITVAGPLNLLLWEMYSLIVMRMGLANIRMLFVTGLIFTGMGILIGLLANLTSDFLRQ